MKNFILFLLLLPTLGSWSQEFQVGAAQAPINPPIPSYIAGHSQNRKFTGIHDSLFVKVVVVDDGKDNLTLLSFDCIGLLYPQLVEIRSRVQKLVPGLRTEHMVMSSTHTHAGPDVVGLWGPNLLETGVDKAYMETLVQTAVEQVNRAWQNRQKCNAVYGVGTHGEGWVHNISEPAELDRSLTTIQFKNRKGTSVATLTNFACHPTFLDAVHHEVSSDYPAGFYRAMDAELGGVNMFLQGSIGGWIQPEGEPQTFEQAYMRGNGLARATMDLLKSGRKLSGRKINFSSKVFEMPIDNPGFIQLSKAGVIQRIIDTSATTEIAWFGIGAASFATHPGETVPAMSHATKALMKTEGPKMVMGLSMDAMGYIIKPSFFDSTQNIPHSKYLCSMSAGPRTMDKVMEVIRELSRN